MYIALALQLGFRLPERAMHETGISAPNYVVLQQYQELAPLGWENLAAVPDVSTLEDSAVAAKMLADLPDEEASSGIFKRALFHYYYNLNHPFYILRYSMYRVVCATVVCLVDLIIESMLGLEYYNRLKAENDPTIMRRVLVTKWMYILGFLNDVFPPAERFVPFHRVNAEE